MTTFMKRGPVFPLAIVCYICGFLGIFAPEAQAQMASEGSSSVAPSGAFNYSIPIRTLPAVGGVVPQLSLGYSSQGSNDVMGMGWGLQGLSSIARCPQTFAQEGLRGGINYDSNDRFCLDGQKIFSTNGGVYGANNTEYRTESDGYSRIISYSEVGATNGPGSFVVKTRSGLTMEYGKTVDSRVEAQGRMDTNGAGPVAVWALNKVVDSQGNYYTISYIENNVVGSTIKDRVGDHYPSRIDYAANSAGDVSAPSSVRFVYDVSARPDLIKYYGAGSVSSITRRMTNVQVFLGGNIVRDYRLTYEIRPLGRSSRIKSITECGVSSCLPALLMSWQEPLQEAFATPPGFFQLTGDYNKNYWTQRSADINGDGKSDLILAHNDTDSWRVMTAFSDGVGGFTVPSNYFGVAGNFDALHWGLQVGDFNGDGKTDVALVHWDNDGWRILVALSNGDGTFTQTSNSFYAAGSYSFTYWNSIQVGDFDGDGRADIALVHTGSDSWRAVVALSNGDGSFNNPSSILNVSGAYVSSYWDVYVGDFDGDGKTDLALGHLGTDSWKLQVAKSNGDGTFSLGQFYQVAGNFDKSYWGLYPGDFNGDGKMDMAIEHHGTDSWQVQVAFARGDGGFDQVSNAFTKTGSFAGDYWSLPQVGDFNGDGKSDIALIHRSTDKWSILPITSSGDGGFVYPTAIFQTATGYANDYWFPMLADLDGDGRMDVALVHNDTDSWKITYAPAPGPQTDLLLSIANGVGGSVVNQYKNLTDNTVYTKGSGAMYPMMNGQPATYVVASQQVSNGLGGQRSVNYQYANLQASLGTGRGSLGFQWMQTKDVSTGLVSRTCYRQDFPYIGMVDKALTATSDVGLPACGAITGLGVLAASGNLLSLTLNSYDFNAYAANDPLWGTPLKTVAAGNRYQILAPQVVSQSRDWDGKTNPSILLPASKTTTVQDNWGRVTQVKNETLATDGVSSTGYSKTTNNTYATPDTTNWRLERVTRSSVTSTAP